MHTVPVTNIDSSLCLNLCAQDDIVHATLTVEENLLFSARYRLPASTSHLQHLLHVQRTLQARHASILHAVARCCSCLSSSPLCGC